MYRCFACDAPAQSNCACHTQVEHPHLTEVGRLRAIEDGAYPHDDQCDVRQPSEAGRAMKRNIASGEDAGYWTIMV